MNWNEIEKHQGENIELKDKVKQIHDIKWSYDPQSYEHKFSNCLEKPENSGLLHGFEPVPSRWRCDALTNWAMGPQTAQGDTQWWMSQWMKRILISFSTELYQLHREAWILHVCLQRTMQTKMSLGEFRKRWYKHKSKRQRLCTYSRIYPNSPTLVWACANSSLL